ncbi:hypothetical protein AB0M43_30760 [Longispora sp. NPDC051575]|uniref:hypothetical protein n=1 Tax=Longispora sp. NPDC051575 TaxID=3154943 RepID=UPI0034442DEB
MSPRRFYRLRTPGTDTQPKGSAVSVRVDPETGQLYLAVGSGRRRMHLTPEEAWTVWRCLSEALGSVGDPPDHIRTDLTATSSRTGGA